MPPSSICSETLLIGRAGGRQPFNTVFPLLNSNKEEDIAVSVVLISVPQRLCRSSSEYRSFAHKIGCSKFIVDIICCFR